MKKIGLVDFYLSEWHADNYLKRIIKANKSMKESEQCEVAYAWAERGVSPTDGVTSAQWCEKTTFGFAARLKSFAKSPIIS